MSRIVCIILFITISTTLLAQKKISNTEAREDFKIFKNILLQGHPALYEYIEETELDLIFTDTETSFEEEITDIELFKKMQLVTDQIRDGHLLLFAPNTLNTTQYYFPLILKIIHTEFYTDTDDFGIPIGSKILQINKKETSHILQSLKKYAPTDGYNLTRKYRDIELKFGLFYMYEYGIEKEFTIVYLAPDGIEKTITVPAESFVNAKHRNINRNSYFSRYHLQKDKVDFFSKHINTKEPFVYYKDYQKTAVLVVNSFGIDIRAFKSRLVQLFKEINKKKIKHLIIDVRNNDGGFRPNSVHLFSFITNTLFKQRTSAFVASLEIPERNYVSRTYANEKEFLKDKFYHHPQYNGWKLNFDDLEVMMVPDRNRFRGKVYVLAGGTTFSAGSAFALLAKNDPDILLVGEETGGGYYSHTGQFPVYYELPNSNIMMLMSMEKLTHYVKDTTIPKGTGVLPDREVLLSVEDLKKGVDSQLDYILRLIKG
ncbi:S41 family peptidase [Aquimarina sp. 2201CG14-23]|uniref:S41 family peptidase n=1 Tax=Aquimarina mycalae TaxID=3040073 RepID=UPI0024780368|nr:S41 family peptidase [Aquimarina sp. 2201CG14-23]MDH7444173.1 S41 family peptidase [Aquimarina sp. 2201CG14-23]